MGFSCCRSRGSTRNGRGALPRHHRDPFDRMLVARAEIERLVLGTQDPKIAAYGVAVLGLGGS